MGKTLSDLRAHSKLKFALCFVRKQMAISKENPYNFDQKSLGGFISGTPLNTHVIFTR